jgi:hypothetical protein
VSHERLAFLRDIVALEVEHLQQTDQRLFQEPMDADRVRRLRHDIDLAERFGWLASVDEWLVVRKLRNRMIHEYVKDPAELAQALQAAHDFVPLLVHTAQRMRQAA